MPRRGYCASCGKEVWQGRDGGCQFGHPASQFSNVHDEDPKAVKQQAATVPAPQRHVGPPPQHPAPASQPYAPPVPPQAAMAAGAAGAAVAPAYAAPAYAAVAPAEIAPAPAPEADTSWGRSPDDMFGAQTSTFDYTGLSNDVSIGNTDCLARRAIARVFDNMLVGMATLAIMVPAFMAAMAASQSSRVAPEAPSWAYPVAFLLDAAYFVLLPYVWKGRTLGKWILGIAVTDLHDHAPSIGQLCIREISMIVDGLLNGILGLFIASRNPRTQRLGDQWADTVVVRTR